MGGIAFEIPKTATKEFLPAEKDELWFVAPLGIQMLSRQESMFPNILEEETKSKSKANGVAKTLVCIQAIWFIAQCITRRKWDHSLSKLPSENKGSYSYIFVSSTTHSH